MTVVRFHGSRSELRPLFAQADDSSAEIDSYIERGDVFVARRARRIVGHVQLLVGGAESEIKSIAVIETERGRGIGAALVRAALNRAFSGGAARVSVATATADIANLRFYQRLGFRMDRVERDAFTIERGYRTLEVDGIPVRDRVWLSIDRIPAVSTPTWIRAGARLGVAGGVLRAVGSFAPMVLSADQAGWLYATIDLCLAAGLCGVFLPRRHRLLSAGAVGFALALLGLVAVRVGRFTSVDLYPFAAGGVAIGVLLLAVSESMARRVHGWVPLAFVASLVIGSAGTFVAGAGVLFVASGVIFGMAFVALSASALRRVA